MDGKQSNRRQLLKGLGALGAAATLEGAARAGKGDSPHLPERPEGCFAQMGTVPFSSPAGFRDELRRKIQATTIVDTHEHLVDEEERLGGRSGLCDDWAALFSYYITPDLAAAGMPEADLARLAARGVDPAAKWRLLAPYWPAVKNTGDGRMVRIAVRELYGIDELSEKAIPRLQRAYEAMRQPGFYRKILVDMGRIESCQVNYGDMFHESRQPTLLMQDLGILHMYMGPHVEEIAKPTGKQVRDLGDWHAVVRWWFDKYAPYAVAVKSQAAYFRGLDHEQVPAEKAEPVFRKKLRGEPVSAAEKKRLEDHLFWFAVDQATRHQLPVKLHTGTYFGQNTLRLGRVAGNPAEAAELCRLSPGTQFVFMHIAYPYWQDLIAVAKNYTNAHVDMCWAWIIDPAAAVRFLKSYLTAAPANKLFTFGGDVGAVECVLGHVEIARQGVAQALGELTDEGWLDRGDALELVEPLLHGNARRVFRIEEKLKRLRKAPWL